MTIAGCIRHDRNGMPLRFPGLSQPLAHHLYAPDGGMEEVTVKKNLHNATVLCVVALLACYIQDEDLSPSGVRFEKMSLITQHKHIQPFFLYAPCNSIGELVATKL